MRDCKEPENWLGMTALRDMRHGFYQLESMVPGAQCACKFLKDGCTPSDSEKFRSLCVSLYIPLVVKETRRLGRTIGLRH